MYYQQRDNRYYGRSFKDAPQTNNFLTSSVTSLRQEQQYRTASHHISQGSERVRSPSMRSGSNRGHELEQVRKPLDGSRHEEAFPEEEGNFSSDGICDDDIPFTDREVMVEDPRSPKPLRSFEPLAMRRFSEYHPTAAAQPQRQSQPVISTEQLMQMLAGQANMGQKKGVDGVMTINGKSFRVVTDRNIRPAISNQGGSFFSSSHRPNVYSQDLDALNRQNERSLRNNSPLRVRVQQRNQLIMPDQINESRHPPMNEQRSTDEPILLASKRMSNLHNQESSAAARRVSVPARHNASPDQYLRPRIRRASENIDFLERMAPQNFNQTMAIGQSLTSQILPKISQTISGGSLQPSQPSDSYDLSPERFQLADQRRSIKLSCFGDMIPEHANDSQTERDGGSPAELPEKKLPFHPPYFQEKTPQKEEPMTEQKVQIEPKIAIVAPKAEEVKAQAQLVQVEVQAELETPPIQALPLVSQIGVLNLSNRKKKKKKLEINVVTANETAERREAPKIIIAANLIVKPTEVINPTEVVKSVEVVKPNEVKPIVVNPIDVKPAGKQLVTKKNKRKKLNIEIGNQRRTEEAEGEASERKVVVNTGKKPPTPKDNSQSSATLLNSMVKDQQQQQQPILKKQSTVIDDFLSQLEGDLNPRRKNQAKASARKTSTEDIFESLNNKSSRRPAEKNNGSSMASNFCDLDQEYIKAHLRRNNSDSIRNKDELKTKKIILRELQDLKESLFYQNDQQKSEIDIAFLHASPIFIDGPSEGKTSLVALKFQKEKTAIIEAIKEEKQHVRFRQSVATKDKFIDIIRKRPTCLHISCHGFDQADTSMRLMQEADQRNLLFETENGDGRLISQRELNKILKQAMTKIKLVFVAACMSDFVGKIFQQCDVPHVICSEQGKTILDEAAISFSKSFYTKLFKGEAVCRAFDQARDEVAVKFNENEANRFQLMISTNPQFKHSKKRCTTRWPQVRGELECLSEHIKFKNLRAKLTSFIPREIEFYKLVCFIQNEPQLAHYRGLPGVGKTYMVRKALTYLSERKYFSAGILYFPLNDSKCVQQFLITLRNRAMAFWKMNHDERFDLRMKFNSESQILDFLVDFFEDKALPQFELVKQKNFSASKNRRFLLVLDNCEGLIDNSGEEFWHLLSFFQDKCKMLKIVVVSRNQLGTIDGGEEVQPLILPQLGSKQAVQFFLNVLEQEKHNVGIDELVELILSSPYYPIAKVFRNIDGVQKLAAISADITPEQKAEVTRLVEYSLNGLDSNSKLVEMLSHHQLFRLLQGNPTSISRAANVYINQFVEIETLKDLYSMIKQNDLSGEAEQTDGDDTRPKPRLNNESLQATTKLAIDMLPSAQSKSLLYFIGLLPAGVTMEQLNDMWGNGKVDSDLPSLIKLNLVEKIEGDRNTERYELNPVLYQFIGQDIEKEDERKFMLEIIFFYKKLLAQIYQSIAIRERDSDQLESPSLSPMRTTSKSYSSFGVNTDFRQINELKSGLKKKTDFQASALSSINSTHHWQWQNSGIEASITSQIIMELPNLNRCMQYLVYAHGLQSDSFHSRQDNEISSFNETNSFRASMVISAQHNSNTVKQKSGSSKRHLFAKGGKSATESLDSVPPQSPLLEQNKSFSSVSSGYKAFDRQSKDSSPSIRVQALGFQNLQRNSARRPTIVIPSNLHVIDELQERLHATRTSMQSEDSPEKQMLQSMMSHQFQPELKKKESAQPFSISLGQLDSDLDSKKMSIAQLAKTAVANILIQKTETFIDLGKSINRCDSFLNTLAQKESSSPKIKAGRLDARAKNDKQIVEDSWGSDSDGEMFERSESTADNLAFQSQISLKDKLCEIKRLSMKEKKSEIISDKLTLNLTNQKPHTQVKHNSQNTNVVRQGSGTTTGGIFVSNLDSKRTLTADEQSDGLGSVRMGDDLEDEMDSDSASQTDKVKNTRNSDDMSSQDARSSAAQQIQIKPCSTTSEMHVDELLNQFDNRESDLDDGDKMPNTGRSISGRGNESNSPFMMHDLSGRDRKLTLQMLKRKSAMVKKDVNSSIDSVAPIAGVAAATMINRQGSLIDRMGRALSKQVAQLKDLNQSAVFTLRKSSHISNKSPKSAIGIWKESSQLTVPQKSSVNQEQPNTQSKHQKSASPAKSAIATGPSPLSQKSTLPASSNNKVLKMSLQGEFIIYTTVNALLVDNVNFAYQVTQTDFSSNASSLLFMANINRMKALASEQIFIRYYDERDVDTHHLVSCITEAVRAANEAYKLYDGFIDGINMFNRNEYGLGLQCFHLGYLYEKYAEILSTLRTVEAHEDVCGGMTEEDFRRKARVNFREAYNHFHVMAHLKGMYMAKQQEADLYEMDSDDETNYQHALKHAKRCKNDYESHVAKYGYRYSCHIPRLHGDVISLLTEIVNDNEGKALFKTPPTTTTQFSTNQKSASVLATNKLRRTRTEPM